MRPVLWAFLEPVLLIIGASDNIGRNTADTFTAKGWKVALASCSKVDKVDGNILHLKGDVGDPVSVAAVFGKVHRIWEYSTSV